LTRLCGQVDLDVLCAKLLNHPESVRGPIACKAGWNNGRYQPLDGFASVAAALRRPAPFLSTCPWNQDNFMLLRSSLGRQLSFEDVEEGGCAGPATASQSLT
jgi:hypothetical protein